MENRPKWRHKLRQKFSRQRLPLMSLPYPVLRMIAQLLLPDDLINFCNSHPELNQFRLFVRRSLAIPAPSLDEIRLVTSQIIAHSEHLREITDSYLFFEFQVPFAQKIECIKISFPQEDWDCNLQWPWINLVKKSVIVASCKMDVRCRDSILKYCLLHREIKIEDPRFVQQISKGDILMFCRQLRERDLRQSQYAEEYFQNFNVKIDLFDY